MVLCTHFSIALRRILYYEYLVLLTGCFALGNGIPRWGYIKGLPQQYTLG
jgi:hypothetical protein